MSYLLDTCLLSEVVKPQPDAGVVAWVASQSAEGLFVSSLTLGELAFGLAVRPPGRQTETLRTWLAAVRRAYAERALPVTEPIALRWAELRAYRRLRGRPLEVIDGLLAATALEHDLTLVTRNVRDFDDTGVDLLNPWSAL